MEGLADDWWPCESVEVTAILLHLSVALGAVLQPGPLEQHRPMFGMVCQSFSSTQPA